MSHATATEGPVSCASAPPDGPLEVHPGLRADLGALPIRRLLPRSRRRLVGPWCFCDAFGPLDVRAGRRLDVAPHPHTGLQTVSWILSGEVLHHDSLGRQGLAAPGVVNVMTAGRGIAHSEETPPAPSAPLHGLQLWVALPEEHRRTAPGFEQHGDLPRVELPGDGAATVFMGELAGARSPAPAFSPLVGAELQLGPPDRELHVPLLPGFEHALLAVAGESALSGQRLAPDTLYFLGVGRHELRLAAVSPGARVVLLGGAPFGETILMWWNFVERTADELHAAREDWQAGRRFGEVAGYNGPRVEAPPFVARPVKG